MAIPQSTILEFEHRVSIQKSAEVVKEAKARGKQTAFLCHSHKDARLAKCLQSFLQEQGWELYIDWDDVTMPDTPNRQTAEKIQQRIRELDWFLFLATENSMTSRWCPWEIGYADGKKPYDSIIIIPTERNGVSHGNEYLELYRHVEPAKGGGFAAFKPGTLGASLSTLRPNY